MPDLNIQRFTIHDSRFAMPMPWRRLTHTIRTEIVVFRRILQHPGTPRLPRWLLTLALFYLLSPVDLIPDWFPVLGQLDDLIIVPFLLRLAIRRIPEEVISECRGGVASGR